MNIKISEKFTLKTLAVFAVFFFMVFFCHISNSYAGIKIIRVGVTPSQSLSEKQEDGHFSGYGIDYLKELQKYNPSWKYEFVEGTQEQLLGLLRKQKIDLLFASKLGSFMGNSHNRTNSQGNFSWSNQPVGQINNLLYSRKDNRHLLFNDYERLVKSRIGFLKGSISIKLFDEYMRQYYSPQYNIASQSANNRHIRFYPDEKALMRALERGEIDAMGTTQLAGRHNLQAIAHYGSTPLYLAARNGSGLMHEIDRSLTLAKANNYRFETDLYEKYYRENTITSPLLNKQELDFVKQHDEISVGFLPDCFPVSSYDRETGKLAGINEDIIKIIFENVGLKLKMIPLEQGEKPVDAIKKGKCDLVAGVVYENFTDDSDFLLSIPFLTSDLVMVSKAGYAFQPENPQKMVINKSFQFLQTYIAKEYPNMTISLTNSLEQSMEAVLGGEADILMQNGYVLNYLIQNPRYDSLHIIPTSFTTEHSAIVGSISHIDPLLISVINKSIASISQKQINTIVNSHTIAQPYTLTMTDAFYKYRVPFLLFGLLVLICLGSAAAFVVMRQRNYRILDEKNRQLADAVLQAERSSQAKGQFLANVSHEIRTPLNAIVGIATIAEKYYSSKEKMQEYMKKITLSSRILLNLINDILDMAAIESKKLRISNNVFNFKDLIVSIGTLYYGECQNKGIKFDLGMKNVSEETLIGDSLRLNQILLNLLSNAVKFTPSGGNVKLKIEDIRKEKETVFLRFTVSDTGEGMTEELKSRLFKPFEQENAETVRQHGGSGLGLSITKNLVNMMHGSISVESKKGEGSTFTVNLPFGMTEDVQEHQSKKFKTIRALIVDDDPEAREYSSIVLSRLEIKHDMAESGEQALQMLKASHDAGEGYDICFIDWQMPDMDGMDVTRRIRELYDDDTIIIIISAYDTSEVENPGKIAGANMFVTKPLFQSTVFNLLLSISNNRFIHYSTDEENYDFKGYKALLAEDNALNTEIAVELLKMVNLDVDCVENGQAACDTFAKAPPGTYDIILMDIQMPIMDGYTATRTIRASSHPDAKTIPIYAMTANAFTDDVAASLSAGMNGHIAKPISTAILYSTLEKHLRHKKEVS